MRDIGNTGRDSNIHVIGDRKGKRGKRIFERNDRHKFSKFDENFRATHSRIPMNLKHKKHEENYTRVY